MESQKASSIIIAVIITALITLSLSYLVFSYLPHSKETAKIQSYKKALFTSALCQYSCPLQEQLFNNQTELLPEQSCVKNCTISSEVKNFNANDFSNSDLLNDNLMKDVESKTNECKRLSTSAENKTINNTAFVTCTRDALKELKGAYNYLN